jgi:hypothetical protein
VTYEDEVWSLPPAATADLIRRSRVMSWARISRNGTLRDVNATLARRAGITEDKLQGASLYTLLTEEDRERMRASLESGDAITPEPFFANFVSTRHEVHTLRCRIFAQGEELVLVGEPDVEEDQAVAEELLRLNNELSVLSRENARRARELEASGRQIEEALAELESSYWHLRKIQERIPFCMRCGKMKTGAVEWTSLVDYLRSNEIFVSHGYCPTCASEVLDEVDEVDE